MLRTRLLQFMSLKLSCLAILAAVAVTTAPTPAQAKFELVERKIKVGNRERSYRAYIPDRVRAGRETSVIFAFHPALGSGKGFVDQANLHRASGAEDFIIVYPEGFRRTWNGGDCCGPAQRRKIDDLGFVKAMFQDLENFGPISKSRNFAAGFSNGWVMSQQVACQMPDRFRAIAGGGAVKQDLSGCGRGSAVSIFIMHGLEDTIAPYQGGKSSLNKTGRGAELPSVAQMANFWKGANNCGSKSSSSRLPGASCESFKGCSGGAEVTVCAVPNMGHWWPGHGGGRKGEKTFGPSRGDLNGAGAAISFFRSKL